MNMTWLICGYCNLRHFMEKPNYKQKKINGLQYPYRQIGLCTKGSFHENGQCNYIKIQFLYRLLCGYFMIRI